jgi:hypothetical protein
VTDSFTKKKRFRVLSSSESQNAKAIATKIGVAQLCRSIPDLSQSLTVLLPYSFQNFKLRLEEAHTAYISMSGEIGDKLQALTKILPQVMDDCSPGLDLDTADVQHR